MIRKATPDDSVAIAAFLEPHVATSMFLLGNLESFGTDNTTHPYGTAFFLRETGDGITGVFGCTNGGFLMCQLPGLTATEAQTYAHLLKGYTLHGMTGEDAQVRTILGALPVRQAAWGLNRAEPLYRRPITGLTTAEHTRAPTAEDVPLLTNWFAGYYQETETAPPGDLTEAAQKRAAEAVGAARIRLLIEDGSPSAMAAINARAGAAVQVGGVYVPPDLRGAGRGGRVVKALLAETAQQGIATAILFAASDPAARAYEAIGFDKIGEYRVALLREALTLGDPR